MFENQTIKKRKMVNINYIISKKILDKVKAIKVKKPKHKIKEKKIKNKFKVISFVINY